MPSPLPLLSLSASLAATAPEPGNAPREPASSEASPGFAVALPACPEDSLPFGARPPEGREAGCELVLPDGRHLRHGPYLAWDEEGHLLEQGSYAYGRREGRWRSWYADGTPRAEGSYLGGLREGRWTFHDERGRLQAQGDYVAGRREGRWVERGPGGALEEGEYREGEREGLWVARHGEAPLEAGGEPLPGAPAPSLPAEERAAAARPPDASPRLLARLKPRAGALPPDPRASTDFTAYTLEAGAFKVGALDLEAGLLDGLQLGTVPLLDALGLHNLQLKVMVLDHGPLAAAVQASRYGTGDEAFRLGLTTLGGTASLQLSRAWSVHGGATYAALAAAGEPSLCEGGALGYRICGSGEEVGPANPLGPQGNDLFGALWSLHAATDLRLDRRDSIVLQASAVSWASLQLADPEQVPDTELPVIGNPSELVGFEGPVPLSETYSLSLAWQVNWKNAQLRLGAGLPLDRPTWLSQSLAFSLRFGGASRAERGRQLRNWRRNRRASRRGFEEG